MEKFADNLKDLIFDKGLSLRKLATVSGVTAIQYSKYLRGAFPYLEVAVRIANYFECSLDYLFGITETKDYKRYKNKNYSLENFIERYDELLKQNNISHYKFAMKNGLSESCLRHWKYGQTPKIESLIIIAENLGGSIDYLVGRIWK